MNISIPFKKVIPFKSSIAEICSISLEHDISINEKELLGDFIITGEYKNLDINVDSTPFEHVIPFSINLDEDIILDTLNYDIENFTYEIVDNNSLAVNITIHVTAEKNISIKEDIFEKEIDNELDDRANIINDIITENNNEEKVNTNNNVEVNNTINIINNENIKEDYITYHIHYAKVNDTIDSIATEYGISKDKLIELNDISKIDIGDKIIIPEINE